MSEFINQLNALKEGKIEKVDVPYEKFNEFRTDWLTLSDKMDFIGTASLNGNISYVYNPAKNPAKNTMKKTTKNEK